MEPEYVDWRVILVLYDISMSLQKCKLSIQKHILKVTEKYIVITVAYTEKSPSVQSVY